MKLNYLKKTLNTFKLIGLLLFLSCSDKEELILLEETQTSVSARTTLNTSEAITIQAEDFDEQSGVRTENTSDSDGGENVGYIDNGDYLEYDLNVPISGSYKFEFRVASRSNTSKFDFYQDNTKLSNVNKAASGGWQTWQTTSKTVTLSAGNSTLKILATGGGWNINWIKITPVDIDQSTDGDEIVVASNSATTIQAEDFNAQSGVRTENTSDSGGGENVGYIDNGDYLEYDLNVANSGSYKFEFRVASRSNTSKFDFYQDNTKLSNVNKAATGAYQTWTTTSKTVSLSAGNSRLKILATGGGWNINWIKITPVDVDEEEEEEEAPSSGTFDFGGVFNIETSDNCGKDTGTDTKDYVTLSNNTSRTQDGLVFFENVNGNYILQSCNQKGTRTEWKQSSVFSLNDSRKMSYNAKFSNYPSAGVTIAQIHNRGGAGRPLLRVEIINGEIEFVIVDTWVKGEGSSYKVAGPDYSEGTYLDLSFEVGNDKIIAKVTTTKGTKTVTYTKNNSNEDFNINDKWYEAGVNNSNNGIYLDEGFYFKAGVYNDSGNNSDHPQGEFTSFVYEE